MAYQDVTHLPAPASGFTVWGHAKVTASKTSGMSLISIRNPLRQPCLATQAVMVINTPSTIASTLNAGTAATDVTSNNQLSGVAGNAPANTVYASLRTASTDVKYVGSNGFLTSYVASGDANGLDMNVGWDLKLLTGGSPVR